jgi:predicted methyltransferase
LAGNRRKVKHMRKSGVVFVVALAALALAAIASNARAQIPPVAALVAETAPIPESQIPPEISSAINAANRPAADKALDAGRKPEEWLAFYGIKPGMQVADLFAGGGYTTELLARIVGPSGKVYSVNPPFPERFKKIGDLWQARLKEPALSNVVAVQKPFDAPDFQIAPARSLDAVIMHLNYHDLVGFKDDMSKVNGAVLAALKPGGVYGIVDHSAAQGSGDRDVSTLHRIDEDFVINQVEKSGFKLSARSSALRHPDDDRTWRVFEHRGHTDRFILKFVKPQ